MYRSFKQVIDAYQDVFEPINRVRVKGKKEGKRRTVDSTNHDNLDDGLVLLLLGVNNGI